MRTAQSLLCLKVFNPPFTDMQGRRHVTLNSHVHSVCLQKRGDIVRNVFADSDWTSICDMKLIEYHAAAANLDTHEITRSISAPASKNTLLFSEYLSLHVCQHEIRDSRQTGTPSNSRVFPSFFTGTFRLSTVQLWRTVKLLWSLSDTTQRLSVLHFSHSVLVLNSLSNERLSLPSL